MTAPDRAGPPVEAPRRGRLTRDGLVLPLVIVGFLVLWQLDGVRALSPLVFGIAAIVTGLGTCAAVAGTYAVISALGRLGRADPPGRGDSGGSA